MNSIKMFLDWAARTPLSTSVGIFLTMLVLIFGDWHSLAKASNAAESSGPLENGNFGRIAIAVALCEMAFGASAWLYEKSHRRKRKGWFPRWNWLRKFTERLVSAEGVCIAALILTPHYLPWTVIAICAVYILMREPFGQGALAPESARLLSASLVITALAFTLVDCFLLWRVQAQEHPTLASDPHLAGLAILTSSLIFSWVFVIVHNERASQH